MKVSEVWRHWKTFVSVCRAKTHVPPVTPGPTAPGRLADLPDPGRTRRQGLQVQTRQRRSSNRAPPKPETFDNATVVTCHVKVRKMEASNTLTWSTTPLPRLPKDPSSQSKCERVYTCMLFCVTGLQCGTIKGWLALVVTCY